METKPHTNNCQPKRLTPFRNCRYLTEEGFDKATGCYAGSAIDEMGLSMAAHRVYYHFVRRASLDKGEYKRWRAGEFRRTVTEGLRSIARFCRSNHKTIARAIDELEKNKLIKVERRQTGNEREVNIYTLLPPTVWCTWLIIAKPEDLQPVPF